MRAVRVLTVAALLVGLLLVLPSTPAAPAAGETTAFGPLTDVALPTDIVAGPDGNLWFTSTDNHRIGRITPSGSVITFEDPENDVLRPTDITVGPDGALWFTSRFSDRIGRITTGGSITTFEDVDGEVDRPAGITLGPDGALWFTNFSNDRIGRITTDGEITTFGAGGGESPQGITTGADGNLWFTSSTGHIGRMTTGGGVTLFATPGMSSPVGITTGPDGNVWFVGASINPIGRMTPTGDVDFFDHPSPMVSIAAPEDIAVGPDGNLWASTGGLADHLLVRVTTAGWVTAFDVGAADGGGVTAGPDGRVWMTSLDDDRILSVSACLPQSFSDVGPTHPFLNDVCWMAEHGISEGYPGGTYRPSIGVSRQAMSAFMYRLAGEPPFDAPEVATFSDVSLEHPFFAEVEWMAEEGITTGYPGGTYRPSIGVSRQAMSAFMFRLADSPTLAPPPTATFSDVSPGHPFYPEIEWMAEEGITTGYPGGTYRPGTVVSRQAMSAFMNRLAPLL